MRLTLVLHNIRSAYNVGAILRTAEGLGVEKVVFSGYTPKYDDMNLLPHLREKLNRQIGKAALGAEEMVAREYVEDLGGWLGEQECVVVGLENNLSDEEDKRKILLGSSDGSAPFLLRGTLSSSKDSDPRPLEESSSMSSKGAKPSLSPNEIILILGEEVRGIPAEIRERCDYFLEIPMRGRKESFNVSVAAGIAIWELMR